MIFLVTLRGSLPNLNTFDRDHHPLFDTFNFHHYKSVFAFTGVGHSDHAAEESVAAVQAVNERRGIRHEDVAQTKLHVVIF